MDLSKKIMFYELCFSDRAKNSVFKVSSKRSWIFGYMWQSHRKLGGIRRGKKEEKLDLVEKKNETEFLAIKPSGIWSGKISGVVCFKKIKGNTLSMSGSTFICEATCWTLPKNGLLFSHSNVIMRSNSYWAPTMCQTLF